METVGVSMAQVQRFLDDFHQKAAIFGTVFRDYRDKNLNSLLKLEISSYRRTEIISALQVEDYSEGPLPDTLYHLSEMWVFGKKEKRREIYIKISMGSSNHPTICISFHIAEKNLNYPFKK